MAESTLDSTPTSPPATITTSDISVTTPSTTHRQSSHNASDAVQDSSNQRETWGRQIEFVLSSLGLTIGLGNIWRFPYMCYKNGGGAFLLPYTIMLFFAGLPLFFMEVAIGQYSSSGLIKVWRAVPPMRGVGFAQIIVAFYVSIYYNVVLMYCYYYFFASFTSSLPWIGCHNSWNTLSCSELYQDCIDSLGIVVDNGSCVMLDHDHLDQDQLTHYNISVNLGDGSYNLSRYTDPLKHSRVLPSQEYWKHEVLKEVPEWTESTKATPVWPLVFCLLFAWITIFLCVIKGVKSAGKVVYFTATFPFLMLFIMLIRALTLDGYYEGIQYYILPQWDELKRPLMWRDATVQIFFSLGAGGGGLLTLASYNKFHNRCYYTSLFVALSNCLTSFIAGFVIFAILGHMAHKLQIPLKTFAHDDLSGFGLVFVACPEALAKFPAAPFWSLMFFFMLILLAIDSQFVGIEIIVTAIIDQFPNKLRSARTRLTAAVCGLLFILGLSMVTNVGGYWMALFDYYAVSFVPLIAGVLLTCSFSYIYGYKRLLDDIRVMIGSHIVDHLHFWWWPFNWLFATPVIIVAVLICNWVFWESPTYNKMGFPPFANAIGVLMLISSLVWFPAFWIYDFVKAQGSFKERLRLIIQPDDSWGPRLQEHRLESWDLHEKNGTTMGGKLNNDRTNTGPVVMSTIESSETDGGAPSNFRYVVFENDHPVHESVS